MTATSTPCPSEKCSSNNLLWTNKASGRWRVRRRYTPPPPHSPPLMILVSYVILRSRILRTEVCVTKRRTWAPFPGVPNLSRRPMIGWYRMMLFITAGPASQNAAPRKRDLATSVQSNSSLPSFVLCASPGCSLPKCRCRLQRER